LLQALHRRDLDVVLVTSPPRSGKVTTRCVEKKPFKVVFRQGHVLEKRESVTLSELLMFPWIFFHRSVHPWLHDPILRGC
jgi:DNA-binding transcriptional LysR family regulator